MTGLATTGANVYKSRVYPLQSGNLPGLCVFTGPEEIDDNEEDGKVETTQERSVMIVVAGYDKVTAGLDDSLDTMAVEVETAIFADRFLSGLVYGIDLVETDQGLTVEGEQPVGEITLTFRAQYLTDEGAPETPL